MARPYQRRKEIEERVPAVSSPVWSEWSAALLKFLSEGPKTWPQIHVWRKGKMGEGKIRNCVAWLEEKKRVVCFQRDDVIHWVSLSWMSDASRREAWIAN